MWAQANPTHFAHPSATSLIGDGERSRRSTREVASEAAARSQGRWTAQAGPTSPEPPDRTNAPARTTSLAQARLRSPATASEVAARRAKCHAAVEGAGVQPGRALRRGAARRTPHPGGRLRTLRAGCGVAMRGAECRLAGWAGCGVPRRRLGRVRSAASPAGRGAEWASGGRGDARGAGTLQSSLATCVVAAGASRPAITISRGSPGPPRADTLAAPVDEGCASV